MNASVKTFPTDDWLAAHCSNIQHHAIEITLSFSQRSRRLKPHHAGLLYAMIRNAFGRMNQTSAALPDGVIVQAPEQLRTEVAADSEYNFGLTILQDTHSATKTAWQLIEGLKRLGSSNAGNSKQQFGGNFRVKCVRDLVKGNEIQAPENLSPVSRDWMIQQIEKAAGRSELTLQFVTPLRSPRSKSRNRAPGHRYSDREQFDLPSFFRRLIGRLQAQGDDAWQQGDLLTFSQPPQVVENNLVWLDVAYGPAGKKKTLGGCVGTLKVGNLSPAHASLLAIGQLIYVGENTRFGFGRYFVPELNQNPFFAKRSVGLLELALNGHLLDAAADRYEVESGTARKIAQDLLEGSYEPAAPYYVSIDKGDGSKRKLAVPQKLDRVLQRAVNDLIAPGIDQFLETSSMAYRHGLGRTRAARRIARCYREGFQWAVKADFDSFFDSLCHQELRKRLLAYIADEQLVEVIMTWVRCGAPSHDRGLPTGAVISPLLSNLFLDQFDEKVSSLDARLIRYADDFLILCKSEHQASQLFERAQAIANQMSLALNVDKTKLVDLAEGFDFLGFSFERKNGWQPASKITAGHLDELGWRQLTKEQKQHGPKIRLTGESQFPSRGIGSTVILGPHVRQLECDDGILMFAKSDGQFRVVGPIASIEQLLVLGGAELSAGFVSQLAHQHVAVLITDDIGRPLTRLGGDTPLAATTVRNQAIKSELDEIRQLVAFELLQAKVANYAALATACPPRGAETTARQLHAIADQMCPAMTLPELRGLEGYAAAIWYRDLGNRISESHQFLTRVAPDAEDPINILLNIGFTQLYRIIEAIIELNGLVPAIGFLHEDRSGHEAFASDIMEAFRFLVDRAVISSSHQISPNDFEVTPDGLFPMQIRPTALRTFEREFFGTLSLGANYGNSEPAITYRMQIARVVRRLKRYLNEQDGDFIVPRYPYRRQETNNKPSSKVKPR